MTSPGDTLAWPGAVRAWNSGADASGELDASGVHAGRRIWRQAA